MPPAQTQKTSQTTKGQLRRPRIISTFSRFLSGIADTVPQTKPNEDLVAPISVYLRSKLGKRISRIVMLWSPRDNRSQDIVSAKVVVDLLGLEIQHPEKEIPPVEFRGQTLDIKGYITLEWGLESSRRVHRMRFLVAAPGASPFDVLLSRRHAAEYGLVDA